MQIDFAYELIKEGLQELANDLLKYPRMQECAPMDFSKGITHILVKKGRRHCIICRQKGRRKVKKRLKKVLREKSAN
jgi:hypothetical protein